ncbi:MAG: hypothetical protein KF773_09430 [Deltaproteobacteria bacterium]|nr:hypothetical protein [Deltaproteobacteria bacterium]MCW5804048.1 hypothetical protein [Deltaproteobacteria bacterium]
MRWSFALVLVVGCETGLTTGGGDDDGVTVSDANPDGRTGPIWPDGSTIDAAPVACENNVPNPPDGHHFSGRDCMDGCHNHGFTLAGTLFTNATGNTAYVGATITIVDANNARTDLVVRQNGNFYTSKSFAFPVKVRASSCPLGKDMVATSPNGRCNSGACHNQSTGVQMHLP